MQLLKFLEQETTTEPYQQVLLIATIAGIANSLLLGIINHATEAISNGEDLTQYFLLYLITFSLFVYAQWYAFERAILIIEDAIYHVRIRLTAKVQQVELTFMEDVGSHQLYSRLTQNDTLVSQAVPQIVGAFQMFILMVFSLIYLGYISPTSFIITLIALGLAGLFFLAQARFVKKALTTVQQKEKVYFNAISQLINGFKEIKINPKKGQDLLQHIATVSKEAQDIKANVRKQESRLWGFGRLFIYALLPLILIVILPNITHETLENIFKISTTLLFLTGPTTIIVNTLPLLNSANIAINDLVALEEEMNAAISATQQKNTNDTVATVLAPLTDFQIIQLNALHFSYASDNSTFSAGPFTEQVNKGELLFIIGGNGSGKSTFLKLLTGLYTPSAGTLSVDNQLIQPSYYPFYRPLFSVIFTDFYLFDKFYGIANATMKEEVTFWLEKMHMQETVQYKEGSFTRTKLSTGQRKRLAFIAAMLENKPILVLDEFAADQDPQFRQYFYETLLLELKAMGKTVIAVTHDDHYFHVADRVLKMENGQLLAYGR